MSGEGEKKSWWRRYVVGEEADSQLGELSVDDPRFKTQDEKALERLTADAPTDITDRAEQAKPESELKN